MMETEIVKLAQALETLASRPASSDEFIDRIRRQFADVDPIRLRRATLYAMTNPDAPCPEALSRLYEAARIL